MVHAAQATFTTDELHVLWPPRGCRRPTHHRHHARPVGPHIHCQCVCGAFLCYHEATQRLVDRDLLVVQHMGSLRPGYDAYVATKAVVEAMTRVLAKELVGTRITTNSVPKTMLVYISIQQMPWDLQEANLIRLLNGSGEVARFGWLG
jgi:NAD(P)-dependent dehydrogenase (short-subunit alcohol dehydrogenase family)